MLGLDSTGGDYSGLEYGPPTPRIPRDRAASKLSCETAVFSEKFTRQTGDMFFSISDLKFVRDRSQ